MRIEHVGFNVKEPEKMVKWYCSNLGMKLVRENKAGWTFFISDDSGMSMLEIYFNPAKPLLDFASLDPMMIHIAFCSDNVERDVKKLQAVGATLESGPEITPAGDILAMLRDPWGIAIQMAKRNLPMIREE